MTSASHSRASIVPLLFASRGGSPVATLTNPLKFLDYSFATSSLLELRAVFAMRTVFPGPRRTNSIWFAAIHRRIVAGFTLSAAARSRTV